MVPLQTNVPFRRQTVKRILRKLAGGDLGGPVGALQLIAHDPMAIQSMFDMPAVHHDPRGVPVTERMYHGSARCIESVGGRGGRQRILAVRGVGVVQ